MAKKYDRKIIRSKNEFEERVIEIYCDANTDEKIWEIYYEDGVVTQMRIHLDDDDKSLKNKTLIISKTHFKENVHLSYERHFIRNGRDVVEEFTNDEMSFYFETERVDNFEICCGFSPEGQLFSVTKTEFDQSGKPIQLDDYVHCDDGSVSFSSQAIED